MVVPYDLANADLGVLETAAHQPAETSPEIHRGRLFITPALTMKTTTENTNTPPAYIARAGAIHASVWESESETGLRFKVTITRLFRQGSGHWQRGRTYYASELATVIEAASKAQRWIQNRQRQLQLAPGATEI
jgi:hypothetical protein